MIIGGVLMSRRRRIHVVGGIYHVIQRGNNKDFIFQEDKDKGFFIKQLKDFKKGMGYKVFGFALMNNHYHIILQILGLPLNEIMHRINSKYSKYYNYKYERVGHVFQGRYAALFVQDENYLLSLLRYVHYNPVKARIVDNVIDYKWTSDYYYRSNLRNGFVDIDIILNMLSSERTKSIASYIEYMNQESVEEKKIYEDKYILGEEENYISVKSTINKFERKSLTSILKSIVSNQYDFDLLTNGSRERHLTKYKIKFIKKALELKYSFEEIGSCLGSSKVAIYNLYKRYS